MNHKKSHNKAGDMRIAGINYVNVQVPAGKTFAELSAITEEYAEFRMFGCEISEAKVTFEEMSRVGAQTAVTRLAGNIVR